ncbi:MAG: PAS domain-containing protein, partial [Sphingomonadales bacterium]|nr:PAS domain-containing protein [Sphingomonadales bacterium]
PKPVSPAAALGFGEELEAFLPKPRAVPTAPKTASGETGAPRRPAPPQPAEVTQFTPEERRAMFRVVRAED